MHYGACPTVLVKSPAGDVVINESDFDPEKHERADPPPLPLPPVPILPPPPGAPDPLAEMTGDWQSFDAARLKGVAASVSGRAVENKAQAIQVIDEALKAHAAK